MPSLSVMLGATLAAVASAQTPPNSQPSTLTPVGLKYGTTVVNPNGELLAQSLVDASEPVVYSNVSYPGTYTFALVDLSVPYRNFPNTTDFASFVPGIEACRVPRLHWWVDEATQGADGVFTGNVTLADYQGPSPPQNDTPHDYVLYLFNRPSTFTPPADAEAFYDASTYNGDDRMNFSVPALAAQLGNPVAARYFTTQNANNTGLIISPCGAAGNVSSHSNSSTSSPTPSATPEPYNPTNSAAQFGLSFAALGAAGVATFLRFL